MLKHQSRPGALDLVMDAGSGVVHCRGYLGLHIYDVVAERLGAAEFDINHAARVGKSPCPNVSHFATACRLAQSTIQRAEFSLNAVARTGAAPSAS